MTTFTVEQLLGRRVQTWFEYAPDYAVSLDTGVIMAVISSTRIVVRMDTSGELEEFPQHCLELIQE